MGTSCIRDVVYINKQRHDKWGEKHSVRSPNVLQNWVQQVKTRQFDSWVNLMELRVRNRHVGDKSDILNGRHGGTRTRGCGQISKRASSLLVDHLLYEHIGLMSTAADLQCAGNKSFFLFGGTFGPQGPWTPVHWRLGLGGFTPWLMLCCLWLWLVHSLLLPFFPLTLRSNEDVVELAHFIVHLL